LAPATLTTAAIEACAEADVPILIATPKRRPVVLLGQRQEARKNRILAAQHRCWAALSETERAQIAAVWVRGKILRQQALIRSRYRAGDAAVLAALDEELRRLARCQRVAAVRGVEGSAARRYYPWLATQHAAWGRWQGRSRPAKDLLNALLNFGYTLLIPVVERWVRVEGLDPYLGALHSSAGRYPSLVFDVVEPFRAAVDRLILALWGRRQIDEADFLPDAASWRLSPDARRTFLLAFDKMVRGGERPLEQEIRSVVASLRQAIEHDQVREWVEKTYYF
jgi:CRISPR-associated protein Cas1